MTLRHTTDCLIPLLLAITLSVFSFSLSADTSSKVADFKIKAEVIQSNGKVDTMFKTGMYGKALKLSASDMQRSQDKRSAIITDHIFRFTINKYEEKYLVDWSVKYKYLKASGRIAKIEGKNVSERRQKFFTLKTLELIDVNAKYLLGSIEGTDYYVQIAPVNITQGKTQQQAKIDSAPATEIKNDLIKKKVDPRIKYKDYVNFIPAKEGDTNRFVELIASMFATLDEHRFPLARKRFSVLLTKRVKLFQKHHGIQATGIVDQETFFALSRAYDEAQ